MDESRLSGELESWQRRRGIHPFDIMAFGAVALLALIGTCCAVMSIEAWTATRVVILICVDVVIMGLTALYFFHKWVQRPNFVTKHGTAVWTHGIEAIDKTLMERALDRFLEVMNEEQSEATQLELRQMLAKTSVEWRRNRVSFIGAGYELRDKAGIQAGYKIMVQWAGNVADSALNHEMLHEVNQVIRLPKLKSKAERDRFHLQNLRHEEPTWWMLEGMLADTF